MFIDRVRGAIDALLAALGRAPARAAPGPARVALVPPALSDLRRSLARAARVLELSDPSDDTSWRFEGHEAGLRYTLSPAEPGAFGIQVEVLELAGGFWVLPVDHRGPGRAIPTGDPRFDAVFSVCGDARSALAALDAAARAAAVALEPADEVSLSLSDGRLRVIIARRLCSDAASYARRALAFAERVGSGDRVDARLLQSARQDPEPAARERCLRALLESPGTGPIARREASAMALRSRDSATRLLGARVGGARALPELLALLADRGLDPGLRSRVLPSLPALPPDAPMAAAVRQLLGRLLLEPDLELRLEAARRLGGIGGPLSPGQEGAMAGLLELVDEPQLEWVMDALRVAGTARSVPALQAMTERRGAIALAAQRAIDGIQRRLVHAEAGGISLSDAPASARGQLSLVEDRAGAISGPRAGPQPEE